MFDPVPWFIGGGAEHSPEIARLLAYAATGGAEGVVSPGDMKVLPLAVPGTKVRIMPGAALMLNRSQGGSQQTYVGRAPSETLVDITATGSGAGRSDLVIARVEDPDFPGWQPPADMRVGPFFKPFVITGVDPATTSAAQLNLPYPAIALARLDIPPSTGTITDTIVKDLRWLAQPRTSREIFMTVPPVEDALSGAAGDGGRQWPMFAPTVRVPDWATEAQVLMTLSMVGHRDGNVQGYMAVLLGAQRSSNITYDFDLNVAAGERHTVLVAGTMDVRALRGTTQVLKTEGRRLSGPGYLVTVEGTHMVYDVVFRETVV